jgi:uncharacterized protein with GYD domain
MPKYLIHGSYTTEGLRGLLKEGGTKRRETVEGMVNGLGGSIEVFYYAFGDDDVFVIADLPDSATATAVALAVNASGAVKIKTTVLQTPEEVDEAITKTINYRPPGQ